MASTGMLLRPTLHPVVSQRKKPSRTRFTALNDGKHITLLPSNNTIGDLAIVVLTEDGPCVVPGGGLLTATASREFAAIDDPGTTVDTSSDLTTQSVYAKGVSIGFEAHSLAASATVCDAVRQFSVPMAPLTATQQALVGQSAVRTLAKDLEPVRAVEEIAKTWASAVSGAAARPCAGQAFLVDTTSTVFQSGSLSGLVLQTCPIQEATPPPTGAHSLGLMSSGLQRHMVRAAAPLLVETAMGLNPLTHRDALTPPVPPPGQREILGFNSTTSAPTAIAEDVAAALDAAIDPATLLSTGFVCLTGPDAHPAVAQLFRRVAAATMELPGLAASSRDMDTGATNVSPLMTAPVGAEVLREANVIAHIMNTAFSKCTAWAHSDACPAMLRAPGMPAFVWSTSDPPAAREWILDTRRPLFKSAPVQFATHEAAVERWCAMASTAVSHQPHSPLGVTELFTEAFAPWRRPSRMPPAPPAVPEEGAARIPARIPSMWRPPRDTSGFSSVDAVLKMIRGTKIQSPQRARLATATMPSQTPSTPPPPLPSAKTRLVQKSKQKKAEGKTVNLAGLGLAIESKRSGPRRAKPKVSTEDADVGALADDEMERKAAKLHADRNMWRLRGVSAAAAKSMRDGKEAEPPSTDDDTEEEGVSHPEFMQMRHFNGSVETSIHATRRIAVSMFSSQAPETLTPFTFVSGPAEVYINRRNRRGIPWIHQSQKAVSMRITPVGSVPSEKMVSTVVGRMKKDIPEARMAVAMDIALCLRVLFTCGVMPEDLCKAWLGAVAETLPGVVAVVRRDQGGMFSRPRPLVTPDMVDLWLQVPGCLVSTLPVATRCVATRLNAAETETWRGHVYMSQVTAAIEWVLVCALRAVGCNTAVASSGRYVGQRRVGKVSDDDDDPHSAPAWEGFMQRAEEMMSCEAVLADRGGDTLRPFFTACGRFECMRAIALAVVGALATEQWDAPGTARVLNMLLSPRGVTCAREAFKTKSDRTLTATYGSGYSIVLFEIIALQDPKSSRASADVLCALFKASRAAVGASANVYNTLEHGMAVNVASRLAFTALCISAPHHPGGVVSPLRVAASSVCTDAAGPKEMQKQFREMGMMGESDERKRHFFKSDDAEMIQRIINTSVLDVHVTQMAMPSAVAMVMQCVGTSPKAPVSNTIPWMKAMDTPQLPKDAVLPSGASINTAGVLPPKTCRVWGASMYPPLDRAMKAMVPVNRSNAEWVMDLVTQVARCSMNFMGVLDGTVEVLPGGGTKRTIPRRRPRSRKMPLPKAPAPPPPPPPRPSADDVIPDDVFSSSDDEFELPPLVPGQVPGSLPLIPLPPPPLPHPPPPPPTKTKKVVKKRARSTGAKPPKTRRRETGIVELLCDFVADGFQVVLVGNTLVVRTASGPLQESMPVQRPQFKTIQEHAKTVGGEEGKAWKALADALVFVCNMKRLRPVKSDYDLWLGDVDNVCHFGWYDEVRPVFNRDTNAWQFIHVRHTDRRSGLVSRCITPADVAHMRATLAHWEGASGAHSRVPTLADIGLTPEQAALRKQSLATTLATIETNEVFADADAGVDPESWMTAPRPATFTRFANKLAERQAAPTSAWVVHWRDVLSTFRR